MNAGKGEDTENFFFFFEKKILKTLSIYMKVLTCMSSTYLS